MINELQGQRIALQSDLAKRVVLKYTPHLSFHLDESLERGDRVLKILQDLEEPPPHDEGT